MSILIPTYIFFMALTKEIIAWKISPPNQGTEVPTEQAPFLFPSLILKSHAVILGLLAMLLVLLGNVGPNLLGIFQISSLGIAIILPAMFFSIILFAATKKKSAQILAAHTLQYTGLLFTTPFFHHVERTHMRTYFFFETFLGIVLLAIGMEVSKLKKTWAKIFSLVQLAGLCLILYPAYQQFTHPLKQLKKPILEAIGPFEFFLFSFVLILISRWVRKQKEHAPSTPEKQSESPVFRKIPSPRNVSDNKAKEDDFV